MNRAQSITFTLTAISLLGVAACGSEDPADSQAPAETAAPAEEVLATDTVSARQTPFGAMAGNVTAPAEFDVAKVYARHVEKDIIYLSYTGDGPYQTVMMFPGTYEVWAETDTLRSEPQTVALETGSELAIDHAMEPYERGAVGQGRFMGLERREKSAGAVWVTYADLYPEDPVKPLFERVCVECHGASFLSFFHKSHAEWDGTVRAMLATRIPQGRVSEDEREALTDYLATHFGPESPDRVMINQDPVPLDAAALANAQYIEFLLPLDEKRPKRWVQEVHIDFEGNVWYTERTLPNAVGRLNPRTGEVTEWELPDPDADPHGMTIDSQGFVYWAEVDEPYLGRLDPRTGEMERFPYDPDGKFGRLGGHTPVLDSKENVWFTLIYGDALGKWDRQTQKISVWEAPTKLSMPYGIDIGPDDVPAYAALYGCHVVTFDLATETFTEIPAQVEPPCVTRRLGVDSKNVIWYGVFSRGQLGRFDPATGDHKTYDMGSRFSEPYDIWRDRGTDDLWISDAGQGGAIVKFDQATEEFTYYPAPRRSDMPKMDVSADGHIWYPIRAIPDGAVGVLLPDKNQVTTLAAKSQAVPD